MTKKNGSYERTNEFRRLQEESRRLSSTLSRQERVNAFDENLRKRVERVLWQKIEHFYSRNVNPPRLLKNTNDFKICEKR